MKEKEISKKQVYDGKLIRVWMADVELEDGTHATREYVERKLGSVTGLLLDKKQNLFLVREYKFVIGKYSTSLPAGRFDPETEKPEDAIVRELREEVGMRPQKVELLFSREGGGTYLWPMHFFYCTDPVADSLPSDDDERIEVIKVPFSDYLRTTLDEGTARSGDFQAIIAVAHKLGLLEVKE